LPWAPDYYVFFDEWYQKGVSRGIAPCSNECGSLSHCARFVFSRALSTKPAVYFVPLFPLFGISFTFLSAPLRRRPRGGLFSRFPGPHSTPIDATGYLTTPHCCSMPLLTVGNVLGLQCSKQGLQLAAAPQNQIGVFQPNTTRA